MMWIKESPLSYLRLATLLLVLFLHTTNSKLSRLLDGACPVNRDYWEHTGVDDIIGAIDSRDKENNRVAKNVVIFLGDGMGVTVSTAARIYKGQKVNSCGEEGYLAWERLPNMALVKTYNTDKQVGDSAATATAYLGGVKTNWFTLGVDARVQLNDCHASQQEDNQVDSILAWAQKEGKRTGFVTTTRVTHATPAATYAHTSNRTWESDRDMPEIIRGFCKDIADQLVHGITGKETGKKLNVIMGGGREKFGSCTAEDKKEKKGCKPRLDKRDLADEWLSDKIEEELKAKYITNLTDLQKLSSDTDYVLGLFNKSHLPYTIDMNEVPFMYDAPTLEDMMLKAISILDKGDKGFVLLVEGGRIDHGLHEDWTRKALEETLEFDRAIETAREILNLTETLMVVTADHSHPITINGYPERGNDILGLAGQTAVGADGLEFTTIMYTNGPGYMFPNKYKAKWDIDDMKKKIMDPTGSLMLGDDNEKFEEEMDDDEMEDEPESGDTHGKSHMVVRVDQGKKPISKRFQSTRDRNYRHLAAVPRKIFEGTHGGEDVAVYAEGPMSHLFHRLHEQSYVAYVMATAACMGKHGKEMCEYLADKTGRMRYSFGNNPTEATSTANDTDTEPLGTVTESSGTTTESSGTTTESSGTTTDSSSAGASFASSGSVSAAFSRIPNNRIGQPIRPRLPPNFVNPIDLLGRHVSVASSAGSSATSRGSSASAAAAASVTVTTI